MCARYTMSTTPDDLIEEFEAILVADSIPPSWNIAPTDEAPIVVESKEGERRIGMSRFGFIPHWADDPRIGVRMLNARVETAAEKPAFRRAFAKHRCLVVADGFYEWKRVGKKKIPFRFHLPEGGPFGLAGLWSIWNDPEGERVSSFTILTGEATGPVQALHDRMPLVLPRASYRAWLDRGRDDRQALESLLAAHRGDDLVADEVSTRVNDVRNDGPELIEPVGDRDDALQ